MKKSKIKGVQVINDEKSYIPDEKLVEFLQEWLQIHKKRDQLTQEGKELSSEDKKRLRELDRMKVYYLDNFIFPSMANLTYFFEAMAASPRFSTGFEDELEELLDPRKAKSAASVSSGMRMSSMQFRRNNLARLVSAAIDIPMEKYPRGEPITDFRIGLIYQILNVVGDNMDSLLSHEHSMSQIWHSFFDDYRKMQGWLALITKSMKESEKEFDRKMGFEPIWFGNRSPTGGWKF